MMKLYSRVAILVLFFTGVTAETYARDKTFLAEARRHFVALITDGELLSKDTDTVFIQRDSQRVRIRSVTIKNETVVSLVPEINGVFAQPSKSEWEIIFDSYKDIKKIRLYLQSLDGFYVDFIPHFNTTIISVVIGNVVIFNSVPVSIAFNTLITMPFDNIINQTRQFIPWKWIVPKNMDYTPYENSRNFAAYLTYNFDMESLPNIMGADDADRIRWYQAMLVQYVNLFLQFVGKSSVPSTQFSPVNDNRTLWSVTEPNFLSEYTKNIIDFMYQFPEFYTANSHMPEGLVPSYMLRTLTAYLYMRYVQKVQSVFIVVIDELQSTKRGEVLKKNVGVRLYVPYFTPSGRFTWYMSDTSALESNIIDTNQKNKQYMFSLYSLRVPRFQVER